MELANASLNKRGEQRKNKSWVLGKLFNWFEEIKPQSGVGPFITLASLVAAIVAINVATDRYEADALRMQLSNDHHNYELLLGQIQEDIEKRIPPTVRSPLLIFPENGQTLVLRPTGKMILELEWADRDREHHHRYRLQVVCIAPIPKQDPWEKPNENARCRGNSLDGEKDDIWTQPGMDSYRKEIDGEGTYAWRIARGEIDGNGDITLFEEWSPYYIFGASGFPVGRVKE